MAAVCVDASFALGLVLPLEHGEGVRRAWKTWEEKKTVVLSPGLFLYETRSVVRNHVWRKNLSEREGVEALGLLEALNVELVQPETLVGTAWEIARRARRPTLYDAYYVAAASRHGCELWTLDLKMMRSMAGIFPFIRTSP